MLLSSEIASRTLTLILDGGHDQRLYPLTRDRASPLIPFGGIYRLIDFTLSNCFNSGLRRINLLTQYRCESLHSYIRALTLRSPLSGNEDGEDNGDESLFCLTHSREYGGAASAVFRILPMLQSSSAESVVILSGNHICRMDFSELLRFHLDRDAHATMAVVERPRSAASQFDVVEANPEGCVIGFEEKPDRPRPAFAGASRSLVNMGVYVFKRQTLVDVLSADAGENQTPDFVKDVIPGLIGSGRVSVYNITRMGIRLGSYWRDIGTLDAYYRVNMELLLNSFFDPYAGAAWPLYGFAGLQPSGSSPANGRTQGLVLDSAVPQDASIAPGSRVIHSVLSPRVTVDSRAEVHNSILMQNVRVGAGARIQRAILDENVRIADGVELGFDPIKDREFGQVTDSGVLVVPANTYVAPVPLQTLRPPHAFPLSLEPKRIG